MEQYNNYCSKEICIEAIEAGCPLKCIGNLVNGEEPAANMTGRRFDYNMKVYKKPTIEQLANWLRKEHDMNCIAERIHLFGDIWVPYAYDIQNNVVSDRSLMVETYEDAMQAAIKSALKSIITRKRYG